MLANSTGLLESAVPEKRKVAVLTPVEQLTALMVKALRDIALPTAGNCPLATVGRLIVYWPLALRSQVPPA
ncbi:Uncharacterised protein [Chromobacterium violaceum]|uniref:Uncharacterized protein n=1 Tax=Chromobacterium violaceum TaxID=536 RepID=A0A3S4HGK2_CHRVL|nr:Uncharacterised protein [Chromobacterium violaceum]